MPPVSTSIPQPITTASGLPSLAASAADLGAVERARRFWSVVYLAGRVYAGYKGTQLWTRFISDANKPELYRRQDLRSARALYHTAISLEGLLIKASQFIATRADLLPDEWVSTLSGLHDRVPPRPFAMIRGRIEAELGRPLNKVFSEFDPTPLASASLAQVHEARLHDGRHCAVKVQYPGIDSIVAADLRNLSFVLKVLAYLEPNFDFRIIAREMLKYIPMELDFLHEADNCERLRKNFAADPDVIVPEVYREYTTRRVLTMEFCEGIKITQVAELERAGIDKHAVAQKLTEVFCEQILRDGFFHADPHPGNILVRPGPRLVLLDFGLAKDFPPSFRDGIVRLTFAILSNDKAAMVRAFTELGFRTRNGDPDTLVALSEAFLGGAVKSGKAYADKEMIEQFSEELPRTLKSNPVVEVPGDVLLVSRVMGLLSGLGKSLDSQVNLMATLMPYAQRLMTTQTGPAVQSAGK
jgi:predicted unusual protein kinase regulating ubiquinone biosynthesis (AarF/ABC1/UbiB family)